jgi:hypothetical protein
MSLYWKFVLYHRGPTEGLVFQCIVRLLFKVSPEDPSSWAHGDGFTDVELSLNCRSQCKVLSWQVGGDPVIKEFLRVPHSNHSTQR